MRRSFAAKGGERTNMATNDERRKMKCCVFCVVAGLAAASYGGGGLDDALKAADKATSTVNDANNAIKTVTQQPVVQPESGSQATVSSENAIGAKDGKVAMTWDAAGYPNIVAKVNAAMPNVMKKMPLRGEQEQWYNAAYELTTIDKQFSFLPPAQRVTRVNPNVQGDVDRFLAWVDGGMQTATAATQPPTGAPVAPSGYDQQPSYANAQVGVPSGQTPGGSANEVGLTEREAMATYKSFRDKIDAAHAKGYAFSEPQLTWGGPAFKFSGRKPSEIKAWEKELDDAIASAKAKAESEEAAAQAAAQKKRDEIKELIAKIDLAVVDFNADVTACNKVVEDYSAKYPGCCDEAVCKRELFGAQHNENLDRFLQDKASGKYDKEMTDYGMGSAISHLERMLDDLTNTTKRVGIIVRDKKVDDAEANAAIAAIKSPALRAAANKAICDINRRAAENLTSKINSEIEIALNNQKVSVEFRDQIWKERDAGTGSAEKLTMVLKKIGDEIENNKKLAEERASLIKKLAVSDVSTWLPEIEKYPKGDARDAIFADALSAKYGTFAEYGKDSDAVADIVAKLYTVEQQQELLDSDKTSISLITAIVSSVKDAALRKKLLLDSTDWAFHTYRKSSEEENQYAYLILLSKEKDIDVLMEVYEKQNVNVNFTYEKAAKTGEPKTTGDALIKMWNDDRNNKGYGYGRLGLWMLDHCGKEFGDRVRKLTEARRAAAKDQTFFMKDFYLGMPKRDYQLVAKNWDEKKGRVFTQFGAYNNRTLSEIRFGGKARFEYLGINKDGLSGLQAFVEKYIPGGMENVGEIQVGAAVENSCDPENPDIEVKSWWYTNCPKYDCRIRMYDSGTICVIFTGDDDYPTLDFSKVK